MSAQLQLDMERSADFSPCRTWRYALHRVWDRDRGSCMFIGLNPSTADETEDDATVRRCIRFARDWGYGGLTMTNVYAYRSTDPRALDTCSAEPAGPANDSWLRLLACQSAIVVAAWGTKAGAPRVAQVLRALQGVDLHVFKLTKHGHPEHPLYQPLAAKPQPWRTA